ncbi:GNAT family N-acetyltransferase [Rhodobacteraceae bacterium XHP0102]|nr:GNAT family N-acetyltransferase [Rhodobacteraceae bacterium XHP0102]
MKQATVTRQPIIETERFCLRPLHKADSGLIALYASDKRLAEMTPNMAHPLPPGAVEALIDRATVGDSADVVWAIDASPSGGAELVGIIELHQMDRAQSEIRYWVAPTMWNTGIASEVVRAMIAANPLANETIFASVFQDNPSSARVLVNAGFEYLGDAESYSVARRAAVPTWTYLKKLG